MCSALIFRLSEEEEDDVYRDGRGAIFLHVHLTDVRSQDWWLGQH
jgi:hypothetical protein